MLPPFSKARMVSNYALSFLCGRVDSISRKQKNEVKPFNFQARTKKHPRYTKSRLFTINYCRKKSLLYWKVYHCQKILLRIIDPLNTSLRRFKSYQSCQFISSLEHDLPFVRSNSHLCYLFPPLNGKDTTIDQRLNSSKLCWKFPPRVRNAHNTGNLLHPLQLLVFTYYSSTLDASKQRDLFRQKL